MYQLYKQAKIYNTEAIREANIRAFNSSYARLGTKEEEK